MNENDPKLKRIREEVEKEFPDDPSLQQIHIARKMIAEEAAAKGLGFLEYVRSRARELSQT